jgi:tetratricopeptide (TPR) repeat protein
MARAAVKAKQQARAQAQPAKRTRGRGKQRGGGGDPNQQLFFTRLRRRQKWVYLALAIVFAATFAGVGVGSGTGGLSDLYSGLFGGGGNPVSKAQAEISKNPKSAKGYRDLALAYETKSDTPEAISALQSYLKLKKKDATAWTELGGLEMTQAETYATQYQQAQSAAQSSDPGQSFQPGGTLNKALGSKPLTQPSSQASSQTVQLYEQAVSTYGVALSSYQKAAKLRPKNAQAQFEVATAAENAGQYQAAITALKHYLTLDPNSPQRAQVRSAIKQLQKALK